MSCRAGAAAVRPPGASHAAGGRSSVPSRRLEDRAGWRADHLQTHPHRARHDHRAARRPRGNACRAGGDPLRGFRTRCYQWDSFQYGRGGRYSPFSKTFVQLPGAYCTGEPPSGRWDTSNPGVQLQPGRPRSRVAVVPRRLGPTARRRRTHSSMAGPGPFGCPSTTPAYGDGTHAASRNSCMVSHAWHEPTSSGRQGMSWVSPDVIWRLL